MLENTAPYSNSLNDLCIEIIKRHEEIAPTSHDSALHTDLRNQDGCFYCQKKGHKYADCRRRIREEAKHRGDHNDKSKYESRPAKSDKDDSTKSKFHKQNFRRFQRPNKNNESAAVVIGTSKPVNDDQENEPMEGIECFLCHQRDDHGAAECPNADMSISYFNNKYTEYEKQNSERDAATPSKKYRIK